MQEEEQRKSNNRRWRLPSTVTEAVCTRPGWEVGFCVLHPKQEQRLHGKQALQANFLHDMRHGLDNAAAWCHDSGTTVPSFLFGSVRQASYKIGSKPAADHD